MLHIVTCDLNGSDGNLVPIRAKLDEMGDAYWVSGTALFLHTSVEAGLVDAALRAVVPKSASFCVVDITGVSEDKYFGRVTPRRESDTFWTWIKANNN